MTSATAGPSGNYGLYNINFSPLSTGEYILYQYDTPIQTIIGEAYTLNADGLIMSNFSSSLIENKAKFFYRIKGTNFVSNKFEFVNERPDTATFQLDFEATLSSHQIEVVLEVNDTSLNGGGASLGVDNVTFKGPIEFLTESKPTKIGDNCNRYNTPLRWKNDLGGLRS